MLFTTIFTSLAIAAAPAWAIPPPIFGFPDSDNHTELGVTYTFNGNQTTVQEGMLFGSNITQTQPQLTVNPALYPSIANYTGTYLILMVDPDASTPENPTRRFILHWLAPNTTQRDITDNTPQRGLRSLTPPSGASVADLVPYNPPTPGNTSSAHRYILYAFAQPANFALPAAFANFSGGANRANFNVTGFMAAAGLSRPMAAEYFYVNRQSNVPGNFIALAGGSYPGGNGGAIFENSPNAAGNGTGGTTTGSGNGSTAGTGSTGTSGAERAGLKGWMIGGLGLVGLWALL